MHNLAFQRLNLNSVYLAFKVKAQNLREAIAGLRSLNVLGFNVTVPHKVSIMKYLDEVDMQAIEIGAVNTVVNQDEMLIGYNTDGIGALAALKEEGVALKGLKVMLLGAGGAAKAIAFSILPLINHLVILNRTEQKAKDLALSLKERLGSEVEWRKMEEATLHEELVDTDLLINATSIGMYPKIDETPVNKIYLHQEMMVFDVVYNPLMTRLLKEAKESGANIVGGVKMLVYQGASAFKLWTGKKPPIYEMCAAVENYLRGN